MSEKKSEASRARWAKIPPEKRSQMMRDAALKLHNSRTPKERRKFAMKMVIGRNKKRYKIRKAKKIYDRRPGIPAI